APGAAPELSSAVCELWSIHRGAGTQLCRAISGQQTHPELVSKLFSDGLPQFLRADQNIPQRRELLRRAFPNVMNAKRRRREKQCRAMPLREFSDRLGICWVRMEHGPHLLYDRKP